jgi:hypothetical protein
MRVVSLPEVTLGGYMAKHDRAAAFSGADGLAYSCAIYAAEEPDSQGRFGGALLFIRWDPTGAHPVGHVETDYLAWGTSKEDVTSRLGSLSLYDVKAALDEAIRDRPEGW